MKKFNYDNYIKNNPLLKEGPLELEKAIDDWLTDRVVGFADYDFDGDDTVTTYDGAGNEIQKYSVKDDMEIGQDQDDFSNDDRIMGLGGDRLLKDAQFLIDDGFDLVDIVNFLKANLK
jgi:hypothetical protein